jgi:aspartyl protease
MATQVRRAANGRGAKQLDSLARPVHKPPAESPKLSDACAIARTMALLVLNCSLCALVFGGDFTVRNSSRSPRVADTPFKLYQGYIIVVDGRIGSLDHQNLLLDTGTNPSMIDQSISAKLGLRGAPRNLALFQQNLVSESVTLPDLQFGALRRQNLRVMVADFSKIGRGLGTRIDAVIGLDVLGGSNFTVDYEKRRILFGASSEPHTVSFTAGRQFIGIDLTTGSRQLHLLVDTGTSQLVLFENHLRDADYVWTSHAGRGQNISGDVPYESVILLQASIGALQVGPQKASVVTSQQEITGDFDGLIGVSCLRPKRVSFDFNRHLLGWSD